MNDAFVVANKDNLNEFVTSARSRSSATLLVAVARVPKDSTGVTWRASRRAASTTRAPDPRATCFSRSSRASRTDDHVLVIDGATRARRGSTLTGLMARASAAAPSGEARRARPPRADAGRAVRAAAALERRPDSAATGSKRVAPVADLTRVVPFAEGLGKITIHRTLRDTRSAS